MIIKNFRSIGNFVFKSINSSKRLISTPPGCTQTGKYLLGESAVVTGSSTGIGLECVKALMENGVMNIVMSTKDDVKLAEQELNKLRRKYIRSCLCFIKCDTANTEDVLHLMTSATELFGRIDIVVNNAGILNELKWDQMVDINFKGVVSGTQFAMNQMGKDRGGNGGAIVNMASILGLGPLAGAPVYTATKHAVIGYTRSMALPYHYKATGIRVMAMCPGVTQTPLISKAHSDKEINPLAKEASRELSSLPAQHSCHCGICLIKMLRDGDCGSVWVTEDREIYEVIIPDRMTYGRR